MAPFNIFNVGTDLTVTIIRNDTGQAISLDGNRTKFSSKATDKVLTSEPSDNGGVPIHRTLANGWSGTIDVDRSADNFSSFFSFMEANYFSGGAPVYCTIETVEPTADGTAVNVYQYKGVQFHGYNPGDWSKEATVKAIVEFVAAQRVKLQ